MDFGLFAIFFLDLIEAKEALQHIGTALNLYNHIISQTDSFGQLEKNMETPYHDLFSKGSANLIGSIKKLLMDAFDALFRSKQSVHEYCGLTTKLLPTFITLINNSTTTDSKAQNNLLHKVLQDGAMNLNKSVQELSTCASIYFDASINLKSLCNLLARDFDENSEHYRSELDRVRRKSKTDGFFSWFSGLFGNTKYEEAVAELKGNIEFVKILYSDLTTEVGDAYRVISDKETKQKLRNEIQIIEQLYAQPVDYATVDNFIRQGLVVQSAENVKSKCQQFRKKILIKFKSAYINQL